MVGWIKFIFHIVVATGFTSCGIIELGSEEIGGTGVWVDPDTGGQRPGTGNGGSSPTISESCYMTALEYPPDYDWVSDLRKGTVKCSLVVYINESPKMKIAVGDVYQVSSEADMHRLINGDLYSDFSTEEETIIKKNGQELFRFSGRESIKGMQIVESDVYTIGQLRTGKGFSYRKNGETLLSKSNGYVFEHFEYSEDYGLNFAFSEMIPAQSGGIERYYIVRDSVITPIALRDDIVKVLDITFRNGEPCYVASVKGTEDLLFVQGEKLTLLNVPPNTSVLSARLYISEHSLYTEAVVGSGSEFSSVLWRNDIYLMQFDNGLTLSSFSESGGSVCCVLNHSARNGNGLVYWNGENYRLPQGYVSAGNHASAFVNGILYAGLTPVDGGRPGLWKDGDITELKFNGYITSIKSFSTLPR